MKLKLWNAVGISGAPVALTAMGISILIGASTVAALVATGCGNNDDDQNSGGNVTVPSVTVPSVIVPSNVTVASVDLRTATPQPSGGMTFEQVNAEFDPRGFWRTGTTADSFMRFRFNGRHGFRFQAAGWRRGTTICNVRVTVNTTVYWISQTIQFESDWYVIPNSAFGEGENMVTIVPGNDLSMNINYASAGDGPDYGANDGGGGGGGSGPIAYKLWKGEFQNSGSYYCLNFMGERALKVTGRPFMIMKYNNITLEVLDCEFGMSEVTQAAIPGVDAAAPEPTLAATSIDYCSQLGLTGSVVLLVTWGQTIVNGVNSFSFEPAGWSPGGVHNERWSFTYNNATMTGYVLNIDTTYCLGRDSDSVPMAFHLSAL